MAYGVFIYKYNSIYDDVPSKQYQFPKSCFSSAEKFINDWVVYLEPSRVPNAKGYFAIAKVKRITPDPDKSGRYLAIIEPGTYLDFGRHVQFKEDNQHLERGLLNEFGKMSGRARNAVRPISPEDFERIVSRGLEAEVLPRNQTNSVSLSDEDVQPIPDYPAREMLARLTTRPVRDKNFRKIVLTAYQETCAITGIKLVNGGGRVEAEAAHIKPVQHDGPDIVCNGIALSGTAHWMFDRGLIGLSNDLEVLISRQANDHDTIKSMINPSGLLIKPNRVTDQPHQEFIEWHRCHCFKH